MSLKLNYQSRSPNVIKINEQTNKSFQFIHFCRSYLHTRKESINRCFVCFPICQLCMFQRDCLLANDLIACHPSLFASWFYSIVLFEIVWYNLTKVVYIKAQSNLFHFICSLTSKQITNMRVHSSFSILFVILCLSLCVVEGISAFHFNSFVVDATEKCIISNAMYWEIIQWFYGKLKFVDVNILTEPNALQSIEHLTEVGNVFLREFYKSEFY